MTIAKAIESIDELMHNTYCQEQKVKWLSLLDAMVKEQLFDAHENPPEVIFEGYGPETPLDMELLIPEPYDEVYPPWLESKIHYHNGEYGKYNQALQQYQALFDAYANRYHGTHMPKGQGFRYF